jgi:fumarate reductase iron-sulfur subunit
MTNCLPIVATRVGFGCMSLLGCHDMCSQRLPLQMQFALVRRETLAMG